MCARTVWKAPAVRLRWNWRALGSVQCGLRTRMLPIRVIRTGAALFHTADLGTVLCTVIRTFCALCTPSKWQASCTASLQCKWLTVRLPPSVLGCYSSSLAVISTVGCANNQTSSELLTLERSIRKRFQLERSDVERRQRMPGDLLSIASAKKKSPH